MSVIRIMQFRGMCDNPMECGGTLVTGDSRDVRCAVCVAGREGEWVPDAPLCAGVRLEQLCQAGGQCVDKESSHYCVCLEGRTGSHCEQEVDPCLAQPCQHGGTCRGYMGGYVCEVRGTRGGKRGTSHIWVCLGTHFCVCSLVWVGVSL